MKNVQEIRESVSLITLAEAAGAKFRDFNHLRSHCPLPRHAGDRSSLAFVIYDNGRRWKCHSSCPADASGGDVISFYMALHNVDFKTAMRALSGESSFLPIAHHTHFVAEKTWQPSDTWKTRAAEFVASARRQMTYSVLQYLCHERGLSKSTVQAFGLGYNPKNVYEDPARWGLEGNKVTLPRGIVIPGLNGGDVHYIKIRRPMPNDQLGKYIPPWTGSDRGPDRKFGGPRGGKSVLFRLQLSDRLPVLVLTEGEWDTILLWEHCADLCDIATLGGAGAKFHTTDLAALTQYFKILVVHDADTAGERGREYIRQMQTISPRFELILPPAHDLTDYWRVGGNLRTWLAPFVSQALQEATQWIDPASSQAIRCTKILSHINKTILHR